MEISREQAIECLNRWKTSNTLVGLYFAARGGTASSRMLARITEVGARITFRNESTVLHYGLYQARFEYRGLQVLLRPSRDAMVSIDGLHIWLESGHWLFVCDGEGVGQSWLESAGFTIEQKGSGGLLESQAEQEFAFEKD